LFAGGSSGRGVDSMLGGSSHRDDKCGPVALKVEDRVLEEAEVSFTVFPRARNSHEDGGYFLFEDLEEFVCWFSVDAREGCMGHLGPNEVS
jgi:hypothetical protein